MLSHGRILQVLTVALSLIRARFRLIVQNFHPVNIEHEFNLSSTAGVVLYLQQDNAAELEGLGATFSDMTILFDSSVVVEEFLLLLLHSSL